MQKLCFFHEYLRLELKYLFTNLYTRFRRELYFKHDMENQNVYPALDKHFSACIIVFYYNNDISFLIDDKIVVLIERQSAINPNMPLRMLLYIAKGYEKIAQKNNLYHMRRGWVEKTRYARRLATA
ncbi:MAG: hypothetical protein LBH98_01015 [Chitinispirillales bacterium]|jgi:hypothetical protein|nr:hypothetical protein [Chitinispirillales bacterium]